MNKLKRKYKSFLGIIQLGEIKELWMVQTGHKTVKVLLERISYQITSFLFKI
jgi:hypothetical protein